MIAFETGVLTMSRRRLILVALLWLIPFSGNAVTPMIVAAYGNSMFLHSDGSVWGLGFNFGGATSPVRTLQLPKIKSIAETNNGATTYALLADGTLWASGWNGQGQLGDGTTQTSNQNQQVIGLPPIKAVAAGSHVLALSESGTVWAWGSNSNGQLGDGTKTDRSRPTQVAGLANVIKISASGFASLALRADGTVWVWGSVCCGSAGDGSDIFDDSNPDINHLVPTQVQHLDRVIEISAGEGGANMAVRDDGTVWVWGNGQDGLLGTGSPGLIVHEVFPVQVPGLANIVAVSALGYRYAAALRGDGTVWTWGSNLFKQLGQSGIGMSPSPIQVPGITDAIAISAGWGHVLVLNRDGSVFAWGWNREGQLGDGTAEDRATPRAVLGPGGPGQLNLLQPMPNRVNQPPSVQLELSTLSGVAPLTVIANAGNSSDADGIIRSYGWSSGDGQRLSGASVNFVFVQPGTYDISLLVEDNEGGQTYAHRQVTVAPSTILRPTQPKIILGNQSAIVLANDGRVRTWGVAWDIGFYDAQTQLQLPTLNSLPILNGTSGAIDIAAGSAVHVLLADGTVLGWGLSDWGDVGVGNAGNQFRQPQRLLDLPPAKALANAWWHSLALTRDGRVFAWGRNVNGQLGTGDTESRFLPTEVAGLDRIVAIAAASGSSAALRDDGTVWAWGGWINGFGPLAGSSLASLRPVQIVGLSNITRVFALDTGLFAQDSGGQMWIYGGTPTAFPTEAGPFPGPRRVPLLDDADQIAGGNQHFIVLKSNGSVWTSGRGSTFGLGFDDAEDVVGLRQVPGILDAIQVAAGPFGSMVLRRDGTLMAWGKNHEGVAGNGTLAVQLTPSLVLNENGDGFLDLIAEVPNVIPSDKIPPFLVATYSSGDLKATTLYADVRGILSEGSFAGANYNVYVAANIPNYAAFPYFQLDSSNAWSALTWPMKQFLSGVALDSQHSVVRTQILENADLSSPELIGASILVGYGTDPDEMLANGRYRTIFTVSAP